MATFSENPIMLPAAFVSKYPAVSSALVAMINAQEGRGINEPSVQQAILHELRQIESSCEALDEVFQSMWTQLGAFQERFFARTVRAYFYLGVADEVRGFVGRLWCAGLRQWPELARQEFFRRIVGTDRTSLFEALDFAPGVFREIPLSAEFMLGWIADARRAVGNDLYQRGLWGCVENYTRYQTSAALQLIEQWLQCRPADRERNAIARMLRWIRELADAGASQWRNGLEKIQTLLCAPGNPEFRALYLESWALAADSPSLDETRALALRNELVQGIGEEELSWCFLLARVVLERSDHWPWAFRELLRMAGTVTAERSRYWLVVAALEGWRAAKSEHAVTREQWLLSCSRCRP